MNYGGGLDHEMSYGGGAAVSLDTSLDNAIGGMLDGESREKAKVVYICGGKKIILRLKICIVGCGKENAFDRDSVIRCIHCGHRIFYKKREKKPIQYLAR